jgi:Flp pilus assembly pilin Flp
MNGKVREPRVRSVWNLLADEAGQDLAEYGIALAIIALGAAAVAAVVAGDVAAIWEAARDAIQDVLP